MRATAVAGAVLALASQIAGAQQSVAHEEMVGLWRYEAPQGGLLVEARMEALDAHTRRMTLCERSYPQRWRLYVPETLPMQQRTGHKGERYASAWYVSVWHEREGAPLYGGWIGHYHESSDPMIAVGSDADLRCFKDVDRHQSVELVERELGWRPSAEQPLVGYWAGTLRYRGGSNKETRRGAIAVIDIDAEGRARGVACRGTIKKNGIWGMVAYRFDTKVRKEGHRAQLGGPRWDFGDDGLVITMRERGWSGDGYFDTERWILRRHEANVEHAHLGIDGAPGAHAQHTPGWEGKMWRTEHPDGCLKTVANLIPVKSAREETPGRAVTSASDGGWRKRLR